MSRPECPPFNPCSVMRRATSPSATSDCTNFQTQSTAVPPAPPMQTSPSCSESRFIIRLLSMLLISRAVAPSMLVSSSTVKNSSSGPCSTDVAAAIAAATPMPSSAPSDVPLAVSHSTPSSVIFSVSIGSLVQSCCTPSAVCGTMSMCA